MSLETNAYKRANATSDGVVPNLYNDQSEKWLYEAEVLRPLCIQDTRLLNKPGRTVNWYKDTAFSVSALTEGTDTPVSALDFNSIVVSIAWYGDAKQLSKETISENFAFVLGNLRYGCSNALAINRDVQIMTEMLNTSESAIYPFSSGTTRYTSSTIVAAGQMTYEQVTKVRTEMRKDRRTLKDVIVHPDQMYSLMNDDKFINADYFRDQSLMNGVVGKFPGNINVIEHTAVQSATENSITVYQAIGLADRSIIYAQKVSPVFEFDEELKRKRGLTFHYYEAFGAKILHTEGIIPIKSA